MNKFSIFNYESQSNSFKVEFNRNLAQKLSSLLHEIKEDDVIGSLDIDGFVTSKGEIKKNSSIVTELYHKVSSGIQVGSGNQILFNSILYAYTSIWDSIAK